VVVSSAIVAVAAAAGGPFAVLFDAATSLVAIIL